MHAGFAACSGNLMAERSVLCLCVVGVVDS